MSKLKYIYLLIAFSLLPQILMAKKVKIGELYYELNDKKKTSKVTYEARSYNNYTDLRSINIPKEITYNSKKYSVTSIGDWAFYGCSGLTSVTIPDSVTSIGRSTFNGCSSLTSVTIPNFVTSIGSYAFQNCSGLTSITIGYSVTSIGDWAFYGCSGLTSITIPNSVTSIGGHAFSGCSGLTSVTIPNSVTSIGEYAFSQCKGLNSVTIPNSVTSIGKRAFVYCSGLTSVTIPNSVTSIGEEAFDDCSGLTSINVEPNNNKFCSIDGVLYSKKRTTLIMCPRGKKGNLVIPNSVTSIGKNAFKCCSGLTSVTIPNSVTSIGYGAFGYCSGLTRVTIPNSVSSIGYGAFYGCSGLTSVTIRSSVTSIGKDAFYRCNSLKQIIAPQNLISELKKKYDNIVIVTNETYYASKDRDYENQKTATGVNLDYTNSSSKTITEIPKEEANNDMTTYTKKSAFQELNESIVSWEEFYRRNRKARLTYENVSQIEAHINREIEKWQVKDEFESTNEWRARVNETTRQQKVRELSATLIEQHNREVAQINEEQKRLAQEYEKYRHELIDGYYRNLVAQATKDFSARDFSLNPYDADHGTFLIRSARYGDILLPIAAREEARSFKENWETIKRNIKPEFVPNGEDVALTKLVFTNNGKRYVYDSHTEANYAVTDVKYNFKPVELADISLADINTNLPALANSDVSSQLLSKSASEAITPQRVQPSKNTVVASDRSDIDYAIPTGRGDANSTTYAVIIANENYKTLSKVPYAVNDGEIMAKYLTSAVGLPQSHVKVYKNATVGSMAEAVSYMEDLGKAYGDRLNLIFYYAGHGVPDEKTKTALLLPVDGNPSISKTCYPVDELVKNLGNLKANNVIVMVDACFSGATRNDEMLVAARGVKLHSNEIVPVGNMVFFSATQGDETAYPYEKESHGLFTYFLLKKLQENRGEVTLGELADYVIENVRQKSIETNGKLQTPTVTVSPSLVGSWRDIQLK